jgi:hypothetical protein
MKNKLVIATTFLLIVYVTQLYAQDWPQFLGPDRNSTSPQKAALKYYGWLDYVEDKTFTFVR